jgi:hypothetical protein
MCKGLRLRRASPRFFPCDHWSAIKFPNGIRCRRRSCHRRVSKSAEAHGVRPARQNPRGHRNLWGCRRRIRRSQATSLIRELRRRGHRRAFAERWRIRACFAYRHGTGSSDLVASPRDGPTVCWRACDVQSASGGLELPSNTLMKTIAANSRHGLSLFGVTGIISNLGSERATPILCLGTISPSGAATCDEAELRIRA